MPMDKALKDTSDVALPKLTKHDQEVLKLLLTQAKMSDTDIAKKLGLSPQAIFKIRHKLEQNGVIKGYRPIIDLKKIGINVLALVFIRITAAVWEKYSEEQVAERIKEMPGIVSAYRVPGAKFSHVLLLGFRDVHAMDKYLAKLQSKFGLELELQKTYSFTVDRMIASSPSGWLQDLFDQKEFVLEEFLMKKK